MFNRIKIKVYGTIKKGIPHTREQLAATDKAMEEALGQLENFLKNTPFVCGEIPTIADLLIYF
jgi:glutathione S-transferase